MQEMKYFSLFFFLLLLASRINCEAVQRQYSVAKTDNGNYFLILHSSKEARNIPDIESVAELLPNKSKILSISDEILKGYRLLSSVPLLKRKNSSPDEKMRVHIQKILAIATPTFWKRSFHFSNRLNPAIEKWENRTLIIWRPNLYDSNITVSWLTHDLSSIDSAFSHAGIASSTPVPINIFKFNQMREDPRLLAMRDGSLVITYTSKESLFEPPKQCFIVGKKNPLTGKLELNDTILLEAKNSKITQKNWIPFEYNERLLFIQSIEPLHVVEHIAHDPVTRRAQLRSVVKVGSNKHSDNGLVHFNNYSSDVSQRRALYHHQHTPLSSIWSADYGLPIRGGTPAILIRGVYLAFFHTVSKFQLPIDLRTYFMGAITFCPRPPFNVHMISRHPIVNESMYQGKWTDSPKIDYVMFPIGIMRDEENENDFVWMSFGHQDIEGWVVQFELDGLFRSMEPVSSCTSEHIPPKKKNSLVAFGSSI